MLLHGFQVEKQKDEEQPALDSPSWSDMGQDQEGDKAEDKAFIVDLSAT